MLRPVDRPPLFGTLPPPPLLPPSNILGRLWPPLLPMDRLSFSQRRLEFLSLESAFFYSSTKLHLKKLFIVL
jgi:hypothetical protein